MRFVKNLSWKFSNIVYASLMYLLVIDSSGGQFFRTFQVATVFGRHPPSRGIFNTAVWSGTGRFRVHESRVKSKSRESYAYKYMIQPLDSPSQLF